MASLDGILGHNFSLTCFLSRQKLNRFTKSSDVIRHGKTSHVSPKLLSGKSSGLYWFHSSSGTATRINTSQFKSFPSLIYIWYTIVTEKHLGMTVNEVKREVQKGTHIESHINGMDVDKLDNSLVSFVL